MNLSFETIARIDEALQYDARMGRFEPSKILQELGNCGFCKSVFYDAAINPASNDYQIVLSATSKSNEGSELVGRRIDFRNCAIGQSGKSGTPVIQKPNDESQPRESIDLAKSLQIFDKPRIHVPLYHKEELIGAITSAWNGNVDLIGADLREALRTLAAIISRAWAISNEQVVLNVIRSLTEDIDPQPSEAIEALLKKITLTTRLALGGRACAIFAFNCYTGKIRKIGEDIFDYRGRNYLEEEYPVGQFLTGRAWNDSTVRHIVDFESYRVRYQQEVSAPSLDFHSTVVGPLSSLLYEKLGTTQTQFLIRIINRDHGRSLPFLSSHRIVLHDIAKQVGAILDDMAHLQRLRGLQSVATAAMRHVTAPRETFKIACKELTSEGISSLTVIALEERAEYIGHVLSTDPKIEAAVEKAKQQDWESDPLLKTVLDCQEEVETFDLRRISHVADNSSHLLQYLKEFYGNILVVVPLRSRAAKGCLFIPCPKEATGAVTETKQRLPKRHLKLLYAYAALIASCIESEQSHVTSENAKRLVAMIGHEVQGPVAKLGQQAIAKILLAVDAIEELATKLPGSRPSISASDLMKAHDEIAQHMQQVGILMDVAVDMAQEAKGVLQVHFQQYDMKDLLDRVSDEVKTTTFYTDAFDVPVGYEFVFNDACRRFPPMIGDKDLLHKAFVNLFRNAVKYSLPPGGRGHPIKIHINGQPQKGNCVVQIQNFGIAVPAEIREKIFQPFVRGDIKDRLKARRGMGLGLYIARRFISAHRGRVICRDSQPTFDDPMRRDVEGWLTTFEVKLPIGLSLGTFDDYER